MHTPGARDQFPGARDIRVPPLDQRLHPPACDPSPDEARALCDEFLQPHPDDRIVTTDTHEPRLSEEELHFLRDALQTSDESYETVVQRPHADLRKATIFAALARYYSGEEPHDIAQGMRIKHHNLLQWIARADVKQIDAPLSPADSE